MKTANASPTSCLDVPDGGRDLSPHVHNWGDSGSGLCNHPPVLLTTCFQNGEPKEQSHSKQEDF